MYNKKMNELKKTYVNKQMNMTKCQKVGPLSRTK